MGKFIPKHFATTLEDFSKQVVPKSVYTEFGWKALLKMDQDVLEFLDEFRKDVGFPLTVNDWVFGGNFNQSGLRNVEFYGTLEKMQKSRSDHLMGRAVDVKCKHLTAHELRLKFIEREEYYFKTYGINFIEVGPLSDGSIMNWAHFGKRVDIDGEVTYWSPKDGVVTKQEVIDKKL